MRVKLTLGLAFIVFSSVSQAAYDVKDLKKLFTDKSQRARIDAMRSGNLSDGEVRQSNKISVNGYVTRSKGKSVVWINNKSTLNGTTLGDVNVYQSSIGKNKKVILSVDGKIKQIKPGETWRKDTDEVIDSQ